MKIKDLSFQAKAKYRDIKRRSKLPVEQELCNYLYSLIEYSIAPESEVFSPAAYITKEEAEFLKETMAKYIGQDKR